MIRSIEPMIDFFLREKGEHIHINGMQQLALIQDAADKIQYEDDKFIRTSVEIKTGDYVDYRSERYLTVSQIDRNEYSFRGRIRKCNDRIAFNWNGNVKWFDSIIEGKAFSIDTGNVISLPDGNVHLSLQNNADTKMISLHQRFYHTHQPFKVTGIDHTVKGIIKLSCTLDLISTPYDDVESNIADRWQFEFPHTNMMKPDSDQSKQNDPLTIRGDSILKLGTIKSYTLGDNGNHSIQWSLRNQDHSTPVMGIITASTGNNVTVKAGSQSSYINKYIVLSATQTSDPTITIEKTIQIKNLF
ncbi:hypothetical protein NLX71_25175 [Paenibacillus sp. MZ04-78.2]|uniref:hypothetical protein n=1 Tax=Paenibacillus sp. MZ04-78.2 TaxID=2962034 RepID=UPI0020B8A441|nr:hypothetical protein [Paenibacillus sp. MZ04-78.2]MCP3776541.1 hypothetical protein [Paenibacillus sp. MZ04-78.2]